MTTPDFKNINEIREYLHELTGLLWQYEHSKVGVEAFKSYPMSLQTALSVLPEIESNTGIPTEKDTLSGSAVYTWRLEDCVISMSPGNPDADDLHTAKLCVHHKAWESEGDDC